MILGVSVVAGASPREEATLCVARLMTIHADVTEAERTARQTNDLSRADCIQQHLINLTGLIEVGRTAQSWLEASHEIDDTEAVAVELEKLKAICLRAERLLQQATGCVALAARRPKKSSPPQIVKAEKPAPASRSAWQQPRRATARNPADCLRQSDLACLLAQALSLSGGGDCINVLEVRNVEPLGGWDGRQCATVDDFCAVVGRALGLEVEDPDDPVSYRQALTEFGFSTDLLLPPNSETGPSVILLDREAREFLSRGLAAPLR